MQQPGDSAATTSAATADTRDGPYQSSTRRRDRSTRRPTTLPALNHVTPQPYVDPIARVKRESIHWKRKVFHVIGIGIVALTYAFTQVTRFEALAILGAVAVIFSSLDMLRFYVPSLNKKVREDFGPFMRDYELNSLSGSTWFFFSSLIAIALFPKTAASLGFLCLALGDPLASWVGLRWGKTRLPGGKSLEGSMTFFAVSALAGVVSLALNPAVTLAVGPMAVLACVVALAGAFAEWLPIKGVDDNFVVPILAGAAVLALVA
jgi:diacylglycerol kinase (CTP)